MEECGTVYNTHYKLASALLAEFWPKVYFQGIVWVWFFYPASRCWTNFMVTLQSYSFGFQSMAAVKERPSQCTKWVLRLQGGRINSNRNVLCVVPALFEASRYPPSLSVAAHSVWPLSGRPPPSGSSPHHSGTSILSKSNILNQCLRSKDEYTLRMAISESMLPRQGISCQTKHYGNPLGLTVVYSRRTSEAFPTDTRVSVSWCHTNLLSLWPVVRPSAQTCLSSAWCWTSPSPFRSTSFPGLRGGKRAHTGINVWHLYTRIIKCCVSHLYRLSSSGHHPVEFRQRANQVQQQDAVIAILKEYSKESEKI